VGPLETFGNVEGPEIGVREGEKDVFQRTELSLLLQRLTRQMPELARKEKLSVTRKQNAWTTSLGSAAPATQDGEQIFILT
jgi:hypothetical protein